MWIKTENGTLLNTDRVVLFEKGSQSLPGTSPHDADYLSWTVRAVLEGDEVVLAATLPSAVATALMERLWYGVRQPKYVSVPVELDAIRADQKAQDASQNESQKGGA